MIAFTDWKKGYSRDVTTSLIFSRSKGPISCADIKRKIPSARNCPGGKREGRGEREGGERVR